MSMTHTVRKPVVNPTRTHDYLYDTVHTLSSERDHARATFKAHTNTDRVKRVPQYNTIFSELRHHPRFTMRLESTDPVPKFISRQWRGYAEQNREALIRYTTFNYAPHLQVPPKTFADPQVSGRNRYRYFRRPIIPFLQQVPPEVILQQSRMDPLGHHEHMQERAPTPLTRTVEIQTDYRESETQTDPYTPEYVVRPGSQPELLTLATLSYGHGLPAGLAEVEMIERARAKRAWEETLPPLNDVSQLEKRKRMMEEMERKEWALREEEIEKLQEARLEMLQKILKEREENHMELNSKRLDKLWSKKQKEKEKKVAWIRKEHIKTIRRLTEKRRKVEGKLERRDITKSYAEYDSQVYAPMTRLGVFLDKGSEQNVVKSKYLTTYQGLLELENYLPAYVTQPRVKAPRPKSQGKTGFIRRAQRKEKELDEVYKGIKAAKNKGQEAAKPLRFLQKIEKPIPRPPTPTVDIPDQQEEEKELAIIFLQQVIRGRAVQNMMFEGKEKRQELINELRSTHALQEAEQQINKEEKQVTLNLQRQRKLYDQKESYIDEALSGLEGASIGDTLDFLSKELVRLQEERRIHAFAMLAERQRRIREAEESGRRQVEERRRREEDEIFKQVIKVHQKSVDTYLEDIIMGSVEQTASKQARQEIQVMADQINQVAYEMEDRRTSLDSEEIVAELVHSFLLPEVQKLTIREKIKQTQRKHLLAAHNTIHKEGEEVISQYPSRRKPSRQTPSSARSSPKPGDAKTPGGSRPASASGRPPSAGSSRKSSKGSRKGSATEHQSPAPVAPSSSRPGSASRNSPILDRVASGQSGARRGSGSSTKSGRAESPKVAKERQTPSISSQATDLPVSSKPQTPVDKPVASSPVITPVPDPAPAAQETAPPSEAEKQPSVEPEQTANKNVAPEEIQSQLENKTGEDTQEEAMADTNQEGDITNKATEDEAKDQPGEQDQDDNKQTIAEDKLSPKTMADSSTQD